LSSVGALTCIDPVRAERDIIQSDKRLISRMIVAHSLWRQQSEFQCVFYIKFASFTAAQTKQSAACCTEPLGDMIKNDVKYTWGNDA
jgi:hypothetical protein